MALWKYDFKHEVKTPLPSPSGSLTRVISSTRIVVANREVQHMMEASKDKAPWKRGLYEHFSAEERHKSENTQPKTE